MMLQRNSATKKKKKNTHRIVIYKRQASHRVFLIINMLCDREHRENREKVKVFTKIDENMPKAKWCTMVREEESRRREKYRRKKHKVYETEEAPPPPEQRNDRKSIF